MKKIKKRFPPEYYLINDIPIEWNPIGLDGNILAEEYIKHIPNLIRAKGSKGAIEEILESMIINDYELEYNPNNLRHKKDLLIVVDKIFALK